MSPWIRKVFRRDPEEPRPLPPELSTRSDLDSTEEQAFEALRRASRAVAQADAQLAAYTRQPPYGR